MENAGKTGGPATKKSAGEYSVDLGFSIMYPFALRAAVLLNVPEIVCSAGAPLSAAEICSHFPISGDERPSAENLEKILDILSCHGVLHSPAAKGGAKKYGSTALLTQLTEGISAHWVRLITEPALIRVWPEMHQFVLRPDRSVYEEIHGKGFYQHASENFPEVLELQFSMSKKMSARHVDFMFEQYDEEFRCFEGTVVDVGGSQGAVAGAIASKYPNISRVINFDLPNVVDTAPPIKGVEHVGGSFLDFVPQGELLIMKFVMLNWNDKQTVHILRNCYNALPAKGKVVIVDRVKLDSFTGADKRRMACQDVLSGMLFTGGRQRTLPELQNMGQAAGFADVHISATSDTLTVLEAIKA